MPQSHDPGRQVQSSAPWICTLAQGARLGRQPRIAVKLLPQAASVRGAGRDTLTEPTAGPDTPQDSYVCAGAVIGDDAVIGKNNLVQGEVYPFEELGGQSDPAPDGSGCT